MFVNVPAREKELSRKIKDIFSEEEKQVIYTACKSSADELSAINKRLADTYWAGRYAADKAAEYYSMARIMEDAMNNEPQEWGMVERAEGFHVYSSMNIWLDFIIVPYENGGEMQEVLEAAYGSWWESGDGENATITEWVCSELDRNGFAGKYGIYLKAGTEGGLDGGGKICR